MKMSVSTLAARRLCALALLFLLISGCAEEAVIVDEIRSIKTVTVGETASGQVRKFSGIVRAVNSATLSFEVGGTVETVHADIGDRVSQGQVLAVLDQEPYQLNLASAEAGLVRARANLTNKRADYEREKAIYEEGAGSKRRLDQAEYEFREARAGVHYAISKRNLAQRDLRKTTLYAPYDGSIGKRLVDPHVEVQPGQTIFEIDAAGEQEVQVGIPETTINLLSVGMPASITFTTLPDRSFQGRVSSVGSLAGEGNAFPVKVALLDPPGEIQSGMTAEVTFHLQDKAERSGYLIPPQAFVPTQVPGEGQVFVYDAASSVVRQRPVKIIGVKDNMAIISEGVSEGDIVAVAGVAFLSDGQKVKLMQTAKQAQRATLELQ